MINVDKLQAVLDYTLVHVESWDQSTYAEAPSSTFTQGPSGISYVECGSAGCIAGNAVQMEPGWVFVAVQPSPWDKTTLHYCSPPDMLKDVLSGERIPLPIASSAARLLGLTATQADMLFWGGNDLVAIWALAYWMTDGAIRLPMALPESLYYPEGSETPHPSPREDNVPEALLTRWSEDPAGRLQELAEQCIGDDSGPFDLPDHLAARLREMADERANQMALL